MNRHVLQEYIMNIGRHTFRCLRIGASVALLGCGGATSQPSTGNPPPPPPGTPNSVVLTNNAFTPTTLNVAAGATVTWTWDSCTGGDGYGGGQTCTSHNIVFDDQAAGSGTLSNGVFTRAFPVAGTFLYHCAIHGAAMSGRIVAQ